MMIRRCFRQAKENEMSLFSKVVDAFRVKPEDAPEPEKETMYGPPDRIMKFRWLAADFLKNVMETSDAFISDHSTLWDFHEEDSNDVFYARALERYGVDVSDIPDAKLLPMMEKIDAGAKVRFWLCEDTPPPEVRTAPTGSGA
jgi:hypothetical protein